ncbi:MAG: AbrB/MazE/SpoVT family DNA-binding domain-containing protein [Bacillota bacterium]|nr:AbrB/MazE/SpoVT family DNA-binding domain-containing protein [Bacillota bacterium]NLV63973.1 AbrB/MazE/SpoVT family DNA-binding domain-containing protein [Clostridiaceae bacterium]
MKIKLTKWGNSAAIRIPKTVLEELNINYNVIENVSFVVNIEGDKLILKKNQEKTKFELLAEQSEGEKLNPKIDIDWGDPIGKEVW